MCCSLAVCCIVMQRDLRIGLYTSPVPTGIYSECDFIHYFNTVWCSAMQCVSERPMYRPIHRSHAIWHILCVCCVLCTSWNTTCIGCLFTTVMQCGAVWCTAFQCAEVCCSARVCSYCFVLQYVCVSTPGAWVCVSTHNMVLLCLLFWVAVCVCMCVYPRQERKARIHLGESSNRHNFWRL